MGSWQREGGEPPNTVDRQIQKKMARLEGEGPQNCRWRNTEEDGQVGRVRDAEKAGGHVTEKDGLPGGERRGTAKLCRWKKGGKWWPAGNRRARDGEKVDGQETEKIGQVMRGGRGAATL